MTKYFEVTVEMVVSTNQNGKEKKVKESYLVDALSVTEAETRVVDDFSKAGVTLDYRVSSVKASKILRLIE